MVPKLRFKNFVLPWNTTIINGKVDIISGFPFEGKHITDDASGIRLMRGVNVSEGIVRHTKDIDRYYPLSAENHLRYMLKSGDIVIGMDGSKVGRNSARINNNDVGSLLVQRVARIRDIGILNTSYLFQLLNSTYFYDYVDRVKTSSGIPHISLKQINEFQIGMPSTEEQTKIADFLSSVDEKITLLNKQFGLLCQYKKCIMQNIFSRKLRFMDDDGAAFPVWENQKLGDVAIFLKGKGVAKKDIVEDGERECIRYGELYTDYGEVISKIKSRTNQSMTNSILSLSHDVLIPSSGETAIDISKASCVLSDGVILGGDLNIIRSKVIDGMFLSYYINSQKKYEIAQMAQGNSVVHLYAKQLAKIDILCPCKKEQTKIANFLSALDDKIAVKKAELDKLKTWKQGLLQQMFI